MLELTDIFRAQARYGISSNASTVDAMPYATYLLGCRRLLTDKTPADYYSWDRKRQHQFTDNLIIQYVRNENKLVEGFVDENGDSLQDELIDRLRTDIVDYGILKDALEDDSVQEIQINDYRTIWVIRGGKAFLYTDKNGKPYQFVSDMELHSTIDRLIYTPTGTVPRMTVTNPLLNTRTAGKGYRLSAVNSSAITPDMTAGFDFPVTSVTIRKYAPSMLTFEDFCKSGTMTEEIAAFLRLCGKANIRLVCVGPTSSGKTTLLNAIVWEIPKDQRLILIQNPTEIMVYQRSPETGTNLRNALHWEASDVDPKLANDPTTPTMANMIAHTLRNTPDVIIPGEVRTPQEFFQMNRALKTGHRVLSTFHASNGADAIERMATELSTLGGSIQDYAASLTKSIDIVVSQMKLEDGSRHVMSVEELTGRIDDSGKAETNVLFRYVLTGQVDKDANGRTTKIHGYFEQVRPISDELIQRFYMAGISSDELSMFVHPPARVEGATNLPSQIQKLKAEEEARVAAEKAEQAKKTDSAVSSLLDYM